MDAEKPVGEDAALEEAAELALNELRQGTVAPAGHKSPQLRLKHGIENSLFRAMTLVRGG